MSPFQIVLNCNCINMRNDYKVHVISITATTTLLSRAIIYRRWWEGDFSVQFMIPEGKYY